MHEGPHTQEAITVACIMDCPTITVHTGKHYKTLIDSRAAISLLHYSTYQHIEDNFNNSIQPKTTKLNTTNGSPKTALGMIALHLRIADFKFTHNFVIGDRLPNTEIIFGIDIQKTFLLSYAWDEEKNYYIQRDGNFLTYTKNCEQRATIDMVKSSLKIPVRHNGVIHIKITGPVTEGHMAYFITEDNSTNGRDPNINIINGIHNIRGKTSVNILVSNYPSKHITFNKGEYIGCLEPTITDDATIDQPETHSVNSVTLQKMMAEQVQPDIFDPTHHKLRLGIKSKLDALLKEYASLFAKDETSIGTKPVTEMTIDTGDSDPVSQKPYHIAMNNHQWVKEQIEKLLSAKVICSSRSSWSTPFIIVPEGDGGKRLEIDYCALNKDTRKITQPMPKVKDIFSKLNGTKYFSTLDL